MKRILITGGLGFIGSALIRHLITHTEHKVLNIDKETYAAMPEALAQIENNENYAFEKIDITSDESLKKAKQALEDAFSPQLQKLLEDGYCEECGYFNGEDKDA